MVVRVLFRLELVNDGDLLLLVEKDAVRCSGAC